MNGFPERTPRTISTASRIGPRVRLPFSRALFRKIFDVPKPSRNRPGPAASCTTRASMATCTGWRVNGEMIPQPTVRRSVSFATRPETTVDERASIPCLRHQGYASASQSVSIPARSMTRADSSISSSGSMVNCITPMRNGGGIRAIFSRGQLLEVESPGPERPVRPPRVVRHRPHPCVADRLVERAGVRVAMCRQPQQRDAVLTRSRLCGGHDLVTDSASTRVRRDADSLHFGPMVRVRRAAEDDLGHSDDLTLLFAHEEQPLALVEPRDHVSVGALEDAATHRVERAERHPGTERVVMHFREACTDVVGLGRVDAAHANRRVGYEPSPIILRPWPPAPACRAPRAPATPAG